jgi:hypothetical protein
MKNKHWFFVLIIIILIISYFFSLKTEKNEYDLKLQQMNELKKDNNLKEISNNAIPKIKLNSDELSINEENPQKIITLFSHPKDQRLTNNNSENYGSYTKEQLEVIKKSHEIKTTNSIPILPKQLEN